MKASALHRILVVLIGFTLSGCGTMANLDGRELPLISESGERDIQFYGGVANDFRWTKQQLGLLVSDQSSGIGNVLSAGFFLADMPVSAVADTVTIPVVLIDKAIFEAYSSFGEELKVDPNEMNSDLIDELGPDQQLLD